MTTELSQPTRFPNPKTGELVTLDAETETLGRWLQDIREYEGKIRDTKSLVNQELLDRMAKRARFTIHTDNGLTLTAPSPKPTDTWDGAALREALLKFVDRGILSIEAVDDAVEVVVSYKTKLAGVRSLASLGGEIAYEIERLRTEVEKPRYVSVRAS